MTRESLAIVLSMVALSLAFIAPAIADSAIINLATLVVAAGVAVIASISIK